MLTWIKSLDRLLRGESTRLPVLCAGNFEIPVLGFLAIINLLGGIYGVCMGLFSVTPGGNGHRMQILASAIKTPALFLLTLLVTFPSLYVFNALLGSRIMLPTLSKLLVGSIAVMLAILSSLGTVVAFFSFTTTSYPFMILLNVAVFSVAGLLGLSFMLQTLHRMSIADAMEQAEELPTEPPPLPSALHKPTADAMSPNVKSVFRIWIVVFGLVGAQMAWVLRPFIGNPVDPFTWFRHPGSNFFVAVARAIQSVFTF